MPVITAQAPDQPSINSAMITVTSPSWSVTRIWAAPGFRPVDVQYGASSKAPRAPQPTCTRRWLWHRSATALLVPLQSVQTRPGAPSWPGVLQSIGDECCRACSHLGPTDDIGGRKSILYAVRVACHTANRKDFFPTFSAKLAELRHR